MGILRKCIFPLFVVLAVQLHHFASGNFLGCAGDGFIAFKDRCYLFSISQWLKVRNADNTCKAQRADLVSIQTQEEFDFLVDEIDRRISLTDADPFRFSHWWRKQFWTSGRREPGKAGWMWNTSRVPEPITTTAVPAIRSSEPLTFTAWFPNEPSHVFEKGITLVHSRGLWGWNDDVITRNLGFICEKELPLLSSNCPPNFRRFRESCYTFVEGMDKGQDRAKHYCNEFAAYLVAINDEPEFDFLCQTIEDIRRSKGQRLDFEVWWTGGSQTFQNHSATEFSMMEFSWDTTVPKLVLSPWFKNRPRGMVNDVYLTLYLKDARWWWFDEPRMTNLSFICEKETQRSVLGGVDDKVCPQGWRQFQGKCYYIAFHLELDRQNAEYYCMEMEGRLVALDKEAEMAFLSTTLREVKNVDGAKWWTGGIPISRHWIWNQDYLSFKGNPDQYLGWAPGEPNNWDDQETFITLLYKDNKWGLNDVPNKDHITLPFICEKQRQDNDGVYCPSKIGRNKLTKLPVTGDNWATLMLDNIFQCSGHIKIWRYYRGNPNGTAYAGVWRKLNDHKYRLVKKTTFQPGEIGRKTVILRHPIPVAAGDIIGVHYENAQAHGGIITSATMQDDAVAENELYTTLSAPIYNDQIHDGIIVDFNLYDPRVSKRTYALFAKLMRIS